MLIQSVPSGDRNGRNFDFSVQPASVGFQVDIIELSLARESACAGRTRFESTGYAETRPRLRVGYARAISRAFHLPSLTALVGCDPLALIDKPNAHASLGRVDGETVLHLRRHKAGAASFITRLLGDGKCQSAEALFNEVLAGPDGQLTLPNEGTFLVIDCSCDLPDRALDHVVDLGDVALSLDSQSQADLAVQARELRNIALSAIALAGSEGAPHDARQLGSARIIFEPPGRPVYMFDVSGQVTMTVQSPLSASQAANAVAFARALAAAPKNLRHVPRLLAQSHQDRLQPLNAFISAWTALELLIVTSFGSYEASWAAAIDQALPAGAKPAADRMRAVMKDKYRLADKFAIMASALDPREADEDFKTFMQLKSARDAFFHTLAASPADLPQDAVRRLLRKYLSLHLSTEPSR